MKSNMIFSKLLVIVFVFLSQSIFAATPCSGVQDGIATTSGKATAFSDCTFELAGDDYYFAVENNVGSINIVGKLNATEFTPNAGTKIITGASAGSAVYGVQDKGIGYVGNCPDVSSSDPGGGLPLIADHFYCVIFDSTTGPKIWIKTMWNGTQFTNSTIAYDPSVLPVELQSFIVD